MKGTVINKDSFRVNERIRISPVRLIDQNNQQVGVVPVDQALQLAQQAGLDLVEVAPNSTPPVCRIMDYGKFLYEQKRKQKANLKKQHIAQLKEIRLRPKTDDHDRDIKLQQAAKFLEKGDRVQFTLMFRGREMMYQDQAQQIFDQIIEQLADKGKPEKPPVLLGKRMNIVLAPVKKPGGH